MRDRRALVLVVALVVLRGLLLAAQISRLPEDVYGHWIANDAMRFHAIATTPGTPYRDFEVEFPPMTVAMVELAQGGEPRSTGVSLAWLQFLLDIGVVAALGWGWGVGSSAAYLVASLPLAPFIYFRLDLLSVALAVLGMALAKRRAPVASGVVLSLAVFAKFWPVVLAAPLAAQRRWRALASFAVATAAGLGAWIAWVGIQGPRQVATFRGSQGWQLESVVGSVLLRFGRLPVVWEGDANRIGTATPTARLAMGLLLVAGVALVGFLARDRGQSTGIVSLAAVALLLLLAPILSWQYLIWLTPWIAVAWIERDQVPAALGFACVLLTAPLIPLGVALTERNGLATGLLLARNVALVALVVACLLALPVRSPMAPAVEED